MGGVEEGCDEKRMQRVPNCLSECSVKRRDESKAPHTMIEVIQQNARCPECEKAGVLLRSREEGEPERKCCVDCMAGLDAAREPDPTLLLARALGDLVGELRLCRQMVLVLVTDMEPGKDGSSTPVQKQAEVAHGGS